MPKTHNTYLPQFVPLVAESVLLPNLRRAFQLSGNGPEQLLDVELVVRERHEVLPELAPRAVRRLDVAVRGQPRQVRVVRSRHDLKRYGGTSSTSGVRVWSCLFNGGRRRGVKMTGGKRESRVVILVIVQNDG